MTLLREWYMLYVSVFILTRIYYLIDMIKKIGRQPRNKMDKRQQQIIYM